MPEPGQRARHSTKRSGCDCLNKTPPLSDRPNGGRCQYCSETTVPGTGTGGVGTGTGVLDRNAPCYFVALFGCDHYTNDAEREHVAVPCTVLRKDCVAGDNDCVWSSRWQCDGTSNPNLDEPILTTEQCFGTPAGNLDGYALFQPCRDVIRCGGQMHFVPDPDGFQTPEQFSCVFDTQFRVNCCQFYWVFDDVQIHELCPEFAEQWAGVDSRDVGQTARCCYCEDAESLSSPGISGEDCSNEFHTVICPHNRDSGTPDFNCCRTDTLLVLDPGASPPSSYVQNCIHCHQGLEPPTEQDYIAFAKDPTIYCSGKIFYKGVTVTACTWAEQPCTGTDGCASPGTEFDEGTGTRGDELDRLSCFTKWEMRPTSTTTAIFRGRTRRGYWANYVCNDWSCYRRSTFTMQVGDYSPELIGLPLCLCIAPHNYVEPQCGQSGQLACCDTGGASLSAKISVTDCDGNLVVDNEWVSFSRGGPLPCGVGNPFPEDECLYFQTRITVDEGCERWGGDLFIVMYCSEHPVPPNITPPCGYPPSSTAYNFHYYCFDKSLPCATDPSGTWVEQGAFCASYVCGCLGPNPPEAHFTKACCCETVPCGGCNIPETLAIEVIAATGDCACAVGEILSLVYQGESGGQHIWHAFGGHLCRPDGSPSYILTCEDGALNLQIACSAAAGTLISQTCDPFTATFTATLAQLAGCCDPIVDGLGAETVTFVIT